MAKWPRHLFFFNLLKQLSYYAIRTQILTKGSMSFEIYSEAESYYTDDEFIAFLPLKPIKFVLILKMVLCCFYITNVKSISEREDTLIFL